MNDEKGNICTYCTTDTGKCVHTRYYACLCWYGHGHLYPSVVALLSWSFTEVDRRKFGNMKLIGPTDSSVLNFSKRNYSFIFYQGSADTNLYFWSRTWRIRNPISCGTMYVVFAFFWLRQDYTCSDDEGMQSLFSPSSFDRSHQTPEVRSRKHGSEVNIIFV